MSPMSPVNALSERGDLVDGVSAEEGEPVGRVVRFVRTLPQSDGEVNPLED
jgi:hypothetical protein